MYNPLVELTLLDGSSVFTRASNIITIENDSNVFCIDTKGNSFYRDVTNTPEIVKLINEIENRNELTMLIH